MASKYIYQLHVIAPNGVAQQRHDSEEPLPEPFTFDDLMTEAGLKRRVVHLEI